jgi:hypothetical protein
VSSAQLSALKTRLEQTQARLEQTQARLAQYQANPGDPTPVAGLTKEDLSGDLLQAGILGYFASVDGADQLAAKTHGKVVAYHLPSYGSFSAQAEPHYWFGIVKRVSFPGVGMDVDRVVVQAAAKDDDKQQRMAFLRQIGAAGSAFEHAVPERLFADPTKPIDDPGQPQGISAVKALAIAAAQGQKVYTLNSSNQAYHAGILAGLGTDGETKAEIADALSAGLEVTVHQAEITAHSWTGMGYTLLDPETGAGAYKISGGTNGGEMETTEGEGLLLDVGLTLLDELGNVYHKLIAKFLQAIGVIEGYIDLIMACPGAAMALAMYAATVITIASTALPLLALGGTLVLSVLFAVWASISISLLITACKLASEYSFSSPANRMASYG